MTATQLELGEQRRDAGIEKVSANNSEFLNTMRHVARRISQWRGQVSADDLRVWADEKGGMQPSHPNAWGGVFKQAGWVCTGRRKSAWPSNHGRWIAVWRWEG